jgi:hypothetical protein
MKLAFPKPTRRKRLPMGKADIEATRERRFKNWRSYVARDGREILHGADWDRRVRELRERAKDQCEFVSEERAERCCAAGRIPSHIEPRHPKRDDRLSNLLWQCFFHDRATEKQNWRRTRFGEGAAERREQA